ncbi:hypothetical protein BAC1_00938 [uncultured bacterium]|nr:hypothetical protein BAC1_00938 [uncultured bacterium]
MKLKGSLLRFVSPSSASEVRLRAAQRAASEEFAPEDEVTVLFVLGFDKNAEVAEAAKKSLQEFPLQRLLEALDATLDALVIKKLLELREDEAVQIMAALNPGIDDATLTNLASNGPEEVITALSEDGGLLSAKPFIKEALAKNPRTSGAVRTMLEGLKPVPAGSAAKPAEREKLQADLTDEKRVKADEQNIYKLVVQLNAGQKLKLALSGNKSARDLLIKDSNKVISMAVLKNPRITEEEVQKITLTKGTNDDMLRHIARNKEWVKSYGIRVGMLTNPKTPLTVSLKLLDTVYEKDLQSIAKSKNVPSTLASAARRKLDAKGKK